MNEHERLPSHLSTNLHYHPRTKLQISQ
jgi:hypothetical protein